MLDPYSCRYMHMNNKHNIRRYVLHIYYSICNKPAESYITLIYMVRRQSLSGSDQILPKCILFLSPFKRKGTRFRVVLTQPGSSLVPSVKRNATICISMLNILLDQILTQPECPSIKDIHPVSWFQKYRALILFLGPKFMPQSGAS